jgi:hypothetical protein
MPRKQKVVEQNQPETQIMEQTIDDTTIQTTLPPEAPAPVDVEVEVLSTLPTDEVKETKVKPKRKAKPKKIEVKEIEEVKEEQAPTPPPQETKENSEEHKNKVKTLEQVKCDTCEKEMTKRTLRYHHKCPGTVIKREELPVKKRVKKEVKKEDEKTDENTSTDKRRTDVNTSMVNHRTEQQSTPIKEPLPDTYHARLQKALEKRAENMQKLASQIV